MRHARSRSDEYHVAVLSGSESEICLRTFADDRSPLSKREVTHRPCCLIADSGKSKSDFLTCIRAAIVQIDTGANLSPVIEQECSLFTIAEHVRECKARLFVHAAASASWPAISTSSMLSSP